MIYAIMFLALFAIGGLTGLFLGALSVDVHLHDTYFIVSSGIQAWGPPVKTAGGSEILFIKATFQSDVDLLRLRSQPGLAAIQKN